jgi:hypothetical protein
MTRDEHIAWAKTRALEYLDRGDIDSAVASMGSDLTKHDETRKLVAGRNPLMMVGMFYAARGDRAAVKRWIEGFQ